MSPCGPLEGLRGHQTWQRVHHVMSTDAHFRFDLDRTPTATRHRLGWRLLPKGSVASIGAGISGLMTAVLIDHCADVAADEVAESVSAGW